MHRFFNFGTMNTAMVAFRNEEEVITVTPLENVEEEIQPYQRFMVHGEGRVQEDFLQMGHLQDAASCGN